MYWHLHFLDLQLFSVVYFRKVLAVYKLISNAFQYVCSIYINFQEIFMSLEAYNLSLISVAIIVFFIDFLYTLLFRYRRQSLISSRLNWLPSFFQCLRINNLKLIICSSFGWLIISFSWENSEKNHAAFREKWFDFFYQKINDWHDNIAIFGLSSLFVFFLYHLIWFQKMS